MDRYDQQIKKSIGSYILKKIRSRATLTQEDKALYCYLLAWKISGVDTKQIAIDLMQLPINNLEEIIYIIFSNAPVGQIEKIIDQTNEDLLKEIMQMNFFDAKIREDFKTINLGRWQHGSV